MSPARAGGATTARQHLVIDGDDTLWENNVHFEAAIEEFIDCLDHSGLDRAQVRAVIDEVERLNLGNQGYGSAAFARNLQEVYRRLSGQAVEPADRERIAELGRRVADHPIEVMAGVEATLGRLAERHDLTLFTKGERDEQTLKVERSGLERFFARVVVTPEKDVGAYLELVAANCFEPSRTWMVGNSPRSDINPALEAGLGAVFIPHARTWSLEVTELAAGERLLVLDSFTELAAHFLA